MAITTQRTIRQLIDTMSNSDKDYRFMATSDLISELQQGCRLDEESEQKISKALVTLLNDINDEVQTQAVKCLVLLSSRLSDMNLLQIFHSLIASIAQSDKGSHRMICAIALKNIITSLLSTNAALLNLVTREPLLPMIEIVENQQDDDVLQEVIEILAEILSRFGGQMQTHHERILFALQQVLHNPRQTLRKRAILALGYLVICLPSTQYESFLRQVVQGKLPVVPRATATGAGEKKFVRQGSDEEIITRLQCLCVLSQHSNRLNPHIDSLLPMVLTYRAHESEEVREAMLQVLEAFILRCPLAMMKHVAELIPFFSQMLAHDPNYAVPDEDEEAMDTDERDSDNDEDGNGFGSDGEEGFTDEDDDDDSWKVRRSAAKCFKAAFSTYGREHLLLFYSEVAPHLIRRFKEREETVLCEIFSAFRELLSQTRSSLERHWGSWSGTMHQSHQIIASSPMQSPSSTSGFHFTPSLSSSTQMGLGSTALGDASSYHYRVLAQDEMQLQPEDEKLLNQFNALCRDTVPRLCRLVGLRGDHSLPPPQISSRQMRIYRETLNVLSDLVLTLPPSCTVGNQAVLANHLVLLLRLVKLIVSGTEFDSNLRLEAMGFLSLLVIRHESPDLWRGLMPDLIAVILKNVGDSFVRISSESLGLLQTLSPRLQGLGVQKNAKEMFDHAFKEMLATDRDMEVKEQTISAVSSLIAYNAMYLQGEIPIFLQALCERLDNEVTRAQVMRSMIELAESPLKIPLESTYPSVLTKVPHLFRQNDRSLRLIAFKFMESLWRTRGVEIRPAELGLETLKELCTSLQEYDTQILQVALCLASHIAQSSVSSNETSRNLLRQRLLPTMIDYLHNGMLHGPALDAFVQLLGVISQMKPPLVPCDEMMEALKRPLKVHKHSHNQMDAMYGVACCIAQLMRHQPEANMLAFLQQTMAFFQTGSEQLANPASSTTLQIHILILAEMGKYLAEEYQSQLLHVLFHVLRSADSSTTAATVGGGAGVSSGGAASTSALEELKKSTATALGRMAVFCLDVFVPFLTEQVERATPELRYFLLHSLKETLTYLCNCEALPTKSDIPASANALWNLLTLYCNAPADGIRNTVGECMGKVILLNPLHLMPKLVAMIRQAQHGAQSNVLFCAAKFTVWSQLPRCLPLNQVRTCAKCLDENFLTLLEVAVFTLRQCAASVDPMDLACQRYILVYVNTLLHLRGALVRRHWLKVAEQAEKSPGASPPAILHLPNFVYQMTIRRQELVHMVEMGPFKHQQDSGLEIRKCAYECMNSLMENCLDILNMGAFCEALERGLDDQNELKHSAYLMLIRLCTLRPLDVVIRLERFLQPIRHLLQEKAKRDLVKQEQDKLMELKRSALRVIAAISFIPDIEKNAIFADFIKNNLPVQSEARLAFDAERRDMQLQHQQMLSLGRHFSATA